MSTFAGLLRTSEATPLTAIPDAEITTSVNEVLDRYSRERNEAQALFVAGETPEASERVELGGIDEGQELGPDGRPRETYVANKIDVAYPMKRVGWALGWNIETYARMTVADLDAQVSAKLAGNARRHMRDIFGALLTKENATYIDEDFGSLTVRRLANGDGTLFPAFGEEDTSAQENHYLTSGYASASMSETNNPFVLAVDEVQEHFADYAEAETVVFINNTQRLDVISKLPTFVDKPANGIVPGAGQAQVLDSDFDVPGEFIGIDGASGARVYVYNRVPANYLLAGVIGAPAPLKRRVPRIPSLQGFQIAAEEQHFPMGKRTWIERFGYGAANRLSFAVVQLTTSGTYTTPADL